MTHVHDNTPLLKTFRFIWKAGVALFHVQNLSHCVVFIVGEKSDEMQGAVCCKDIKTVGPLSIATWQRNIQPTWELCENFGLEKLIEREDIEDLQVDRRIILNWITNQVWREDVHWIQVAQDADRFRTPVNTELVWLPERPSVCQRLFSWGQSVRNLVSWSKSTSRYHRCNFIQFN
jgi:hypothetical protein